MEDNARRRPILPASPLRGGIAAGLAAAIVLVAACGGDGSSVQPPPSRPDGPQTIRIGVLAPETGPDAATGVAARWLLEERVGELNEEHRDAEPAYTFELEVVDTESDPEVAREAFRGLADDGVRIVIGPFSDAEVKAVSDLTGGVLVASPGSSAIALGLVDNVLRFMPDDRVQAAALVDLARHRGIETIAPIGRDDPGNAALQEEVAGAFEALGGGVAEAVDYPPDAARYGASVEELARETARALEVLGPDAAGTVGVVVAGEGEVPQLLTLAAGTPELGNLPWFANRGVAGSESLVANPSAAELAARVGLLATSAGLDPAAEDRWKPLVVRGKEQTGVEPDAVALAAYDALGVVVGAVVASAFPASDATNADVRALRTAVAREALVAEGVTGPLKLDERGDRTTGAFDVWSVCESPTGYEWRRTAVWTPGPDGLTGGAITGSAAC